MKELPPNLEEAIGLTIRLKPDVSELTKKNFGTELYKFNVSYKYPKVPIEERIRLHPIENGVVSTNCHLLAAYMGYEQIREKFEIVN